MWLARLRKRLQFGQGVYENMKYILIHLENTLVYFLGGLFLNWVGFPIKFMLILFIVVAIAEGFFAQHLPNTGKTPEDRLKGYVNSITTAFIFLLLGYLIGGEIQP